jgi:prepilin signal peptidase PulO-like enzyme (type II secretory pathway)
MDAFLFFSQFVLFVVLVASSLGKLKKLPEFRSTLDEFGVPPWARTPISIGLPAIEFSVAVLFLSTATAKFAAVGATLLIGALTGVVAWSLIRGRHPTCNCFGAIAAKPIGWETLARNLTLLAMALGVTIVGDYVPGLGLLAAAGNYLEATTVLIVCCLLVVLLEAWLIFQLLRQQGRVIVAIDNIEQRLNTLGIGTQYTEQPALNGLTVGTLAPAFDLPLLKKGRVTLQKLLGRHLPVLILFVDPECGPCKTLLPRAAGWHASLRDQFSLAVISTGALPDNERRFGSLGFDILGVQQGREVAEAYLSVATPCAVLVSADGIIMEPTALGADAISALVAIHFESKRALQTPELAATIEHA